MSNQWFQAQVVGPEMTTPAAKPRTLQRDASPPQVKVSVWQQLDPSSLDGGRPEPRGVVTPAASGRIGSHISAKILELQKQAHLENVASVEHKKDKEVHGGKVEPVTSEVQKREKKVKEKRDSKGTLESLSSDIVIQDSDTISSNSDSFKEERQIVFIDGDKEIKSEVQTPINKNVNSKNTEDATVLSDYIKSKAVFTQHESNANKNNQNYKNLHDKSKKCDDDISEKTKPSPPSHLGLQDTNKSSNNPLDSDLLQDTRRGSSTPLHSGLQDTRRGSSTPLHSDLQDARRGSSTPLHSDLQDARRGSSTPFHSDLQDGRRGSSTPFHSDLQDTRRGSSTPVHSDLQDGRRGSSTPLHSETIRIQSPNTPEQTLELTLTVSNVIHEATTPPDLSTLLSPTQKLQFSLGSHRPREEQQRRGFVDPNILKLLPTEEEDEFSQSPSLSRRSSEPYEKHNESRRFSAPINNTKENKFKNALDGLQSLDSDEDEVNMTSEDLEILSLKLEAVTVNATYLLTKTNNFGGSRLELEELEDEIERTQRALNDIVIFEHPELAPQIALASRTLGACKMILEDHSPTIETLEPGEEGRRRRTSSGGEVRSVAMRVLKLNKVVQQERRGSAEFLEHQLKRGGADDH